MINPFHFRLYIVKYSLTNTKLWSQEAEDLLCGTALVESKLSELVQVPSGYAKSFFQIEEVTYNYLVKRCVFRRSRLFKRICKFLNIEKFPEDPNFLVGNMYAACLIARLKYLFNPTPIPKSLKGQAEYWNKIYNTNISRSHQARYVRIYEDVYGEENC